MDETRNGSKTRTRKAQAKLKNGAGYIIMRFCDSVKRPVITPLNAEYATLPNKPPGLKVELYEHQKTVVQAMLDIEDTREVFCEDAAKAIHDVEGPLRVTTSGMLLSEPFGSGKTIEILTLILCRPVPRATPHITRMAKAKPGHWVPYYEVKFAGKGVLIRPTIIVVGHSVVHQWIESIKKFTDLKCFVVSDFYKLREFKTLISTNKIRTYDIILVKNGTVTVDNKQNNMLTVIKEATEGMCWARAVYDDFDTIGIKIDIEKFPALFTLYVSATAEYNSRPYSTSHRRIQTVVQDKLLCTVFNVVTDPEFLRFSMSIPSIKAYEYVYNSINDKYIELIGEMGAKTIVEMLNGDAPAAAAKSLNMVTTSPADIFRKLMDDNYDTYIRNRKVYEYLSVVLPDLEELPRVANEDIDDSYYKKVKAGVKIDCISNGLLARIKTLYEKSLKRMTDAKITIDRVQSNIQDAECQICRLPLCESNVLIVKCCGTVMCDICGFKGCYIRHEYNYKTRETGMMAKCANCKAGINPLTDMVVISQGDSIDDLINANIVLSTVGSDINTDETPVEKPKSYSKMDALYDIVCGKVPQNRKVFDIHVKGLITPSVDVPVPDNAPRKVLVFANYNESLDVAEKYLKEKGVSFLVLSGTSAKKAETIERFRLGSYARVGENDNCQGINGGQDGNGQVGNDQVGNNVNKGDNDQSIQVLFINSQQNCAGLNLQFATDLVFLHRIYDEAIEAQVIGRIHRAGRVFNSSVHYLSYNNERIN